MTRQINLFNPTLRLRREWLTGATLLAGLAVLAIFLAAYGGALYWQQQRLSEESARASVELQQLQDELAKFNEDISQRRLSKEIEGNLARAEAALRGRERVRQALQGGLLGSSEGFSEYLRAMARQSQSGLWLVGLQVADGGRGISLEGRTTNPDQIPGYIRALNTETSLRGRSFEAMNVQLIGDEKPAQAAAATAGQAAQGETVKLPPYHEFLLAARPASEQGGGAAAGGQR